VWKRDAVRVGYHWYYQDGTELAWEDETTAIAQDVPLGGRVDDMLAWVTAPPNDGLYWLVWDVKVGDTWASTSASTRVFDESVRPVQVIHGRLTFADLTKAYNVDGVTDDDTLGEGSFDSRGDAFPAALVPPFANADVTPVGMWLPSTKTGPDSSHRISFHWGPKDPGEKNFISCRGQRLELGKSAGECRILHILAASTDQDVLTGMKLVFQEPTSQSIDLYAFQASPWDRPPLHGEEVAFLCYGHNTRDGLQPGAVALYHYTVTIREPRKLVALVLPNKPEIKIGAITLER
jgi:hypothetical protein